MATPIAASLPQADGIESALAMIGESEGTVRVFRKRLGQRPGHVATYPVSEFSIEAVARDHGGGDYFCQVCSAEQGKPIVGTGDISVDAGVRPQRRPAPPLAPPAYPFAGYEQPAPPPADPLAIIMQRLDRIEQGRAAAPETGGPSWRDVFALVQQQQPSAQATSGVAEMMKLLPLFLEAVKPKSTIGELAEGLKLMRSVSRSGVAERYDAGEGDGLGALLNGPLATMLAQRFLDPGAAATPAPAPRPRFTPPVALPAPSPVMASPPPPGPPAATVTAAPQPEEPYIPETITAAAREFAPMLAAMLRANPATPAARIADLCAAGSDPDELGEHLAQMQEGTFAGVFVQADRSLLPFSAKLIVAEGMLRELVRAPEPDAKEGDENEEADTDDDHGAGEGGQPGLADANIEQATGPTTPAAVVISPPTPPKVIRQRGKKRP